MSSKVINYNPANWYWIVAGSTTQVYSSAAGAYVPVSNATYLSWKAAGNTPTNIASEQDLIDVLVLAGLPAPSGTVPSDSVKNKQFDDVPKAVQVWAFA